MTAVTPFAVTPFAVPATAPAATMASISPADVRTLVREQIERHRLSQAAIAKESGISASILSSFLTAKYAGDNDAVAAKLAAWLDRRGTAAGSTIPGQPDWRHSPTAADILLAMEYAHLYRDIAVIYGGAGFGKTVTAQEYQRRNPGNVWIVTADPTSANVAVFLEEVATAVGLRDFPLHPARLRRAIVGRLRDTGGLLIVDEAQHVTKLALEAARGLHDAAGVGLVVQGNARIYDRMYGGGKSAEDFAQIFSRVGKRLALRLPAEGDVQALAEHFGVSGAAERAFLMETSRRHGALRLVVKVLRMAATLAAGAGREIDVTLLRAALIDLHGAASDAA